MFQPSTLIDADFVRTQLTGELFTPADEGWDAARAAWNLAVDQRPECVAIPADADDVVALVGFAREAGLRDRRPGHRPQRRAARQPRADDADQDRAHALASRSTPAPGSPGSRRAPPGARSPGRRPRTA